MRKFSVRSVPADCHGEAQFKKNSNLGVAVPCASVRNVYRYTHIQEKHRHRHTQYHDL
jgi:hypothetical protein